MAECLTEGRPVEHAISRAVAFLESRPEDGLEKFNHLLLGLVIESQKMGGARDLSQIEKYKAEIHRITEKLQDLFNSTVGGPQRPEVDEPMGGPVAEAAYWLREAGREEVAEALLREVAAISQSAAHGAAALPDEDRTRQFGDPQGPAWRRGRFSGLEPGERLVEMDCCLFRFSVQHYTGDSYNPVYTCPLCEPRTAQRPELPEATPTCRVCGEPAYISIMPGIAVRGVTGSFCSWDCVNTAERGAAPEGA